MKCEKHNVDMYWKGDLRSGTMHCDHCDILTINTIHMDLDFGSGEFKIEPKHFAHGIHGSIPIPDAVPAPAPATRGQGTVDPNNFGDEVSFRRARFEAANKALDVWRHNGMATCEYCGQRDGPGHMNSHSCEQAYWNDQKFLSGRGIRI